MDALRNTSKAKLVYDFIFFNIQVHVNNIPKKKTNIRLPYFGYLIEQLNVFPKLLVITYSSYLLNYKIKSKQSIVLSRMHFP